MYSKKLTEKLVDLHKDKMIEDLGLRKFTICFHVCSSKSSYLKQFGVSKATRSNKCGLSFIGAKRADVILFNDNLSSKNDVLSTLFHEMLHLAMAEIMDMITIKSDKADVVEEKLVLRLESIYARGLK